MALASGHRASMKELFLSWSWQLTMGMLVIAFIVMSSVLLMQEKQLTNQLEGRNQLVSELMVAHGKLLSLGTPLHASMPEISTGEPPGAAASFTTDELHAEANRLWADLVATSKGLSRRVRNVTGIMAPEIVLPKMSEIYEAYKEWISYDEPTSTEARLAAQRVLGLTLASISALNNGINYVHEKTLATHSELKGTRRNLTMFVFTAYMICVLSLLMMTLYRRDIVRRTRAEESEQAAATELARSNRELEQFAYIASHDLKAPLRGIENLATWIEEDLEGQLTGETAEHMQLLRGRVRRMERLLDDLLQYSRAGRIQGEVSQVDTRALVEEVVGFLAPREGMQVIADESLPTIHAHKGPLAQVLQNLIGNAIKHHDRDQGTVRVGARAVGDSYEFAIADDGPGIPPEFHDRVFGMFQTLKPRDQVEGSGVGLAVVKKVVEWQGGTIVVDSSPGQRGTTFRFTWRKVPSVSATS